MALQANNESRWEIWLDDPLGNRLALLDNAISFSIARVANSPGAFSLQLPADFDDKLLTLDGLVEFWRAPAGGALKWAGVGMMRKFVYAEDSQGNEIISVSGPDGIDILSRRIVAYYAGHGSAGATDQADDLIKGIARQNFTSLAIAARRLTAEQFSVQPDQGLGPSVTKAYAWRDVLKVAQEIAEGAQVYFDLVPVLISQYQIGFEMHTYIGQAQDRSYSSGNPLIFGREWGNLSSPILEYDYTEEVNAVYAGGQGEGDGREVVTELDTARIGASPWNRREAFVDGRENEKVIGITSPGLVAKAKSALAAGRPRTRFSANLLDTESSQFGVDWDFLYRVTAEHRGRQFDGIVRAVRLGKTPDGDEFIESKLEVELS